MRRRSAVTSIVMMSTPSISTWPLLGSTSRLTIFRLVVLPQPLGPTRTQMSPAGTSSDRSTTAPCGPYCLLTWRNSTVALVTLEALPGTDRYVQPAVRRGQRTYPAWIEGARRVVRVIEIEHHYGGRGVRTEVGAFDRVQQIATAAVSFVAARGVLERNEQAAGVAFDPECAKC